MIHRYLLRHTWSTLSSAWLLVVSKEPKRPSPSTETATSHGYRGGFPVLRIESLINRSANLCSSSQDVPCRRPARQPQQPSANSFSMCTPSCCTQTSCIRHGTCVRGAFLISVISLRGSAKGNCTQFAMLAGIPKYNVMTQPWHLSPRPSLGPHSC